MIVHGDDRAVTSSCYVAFTPTEDLLGGCPPRSRNECAELTVRGDDHAVMSSYGVAFTPSEDLIGGSARRSRNDCAELIVRGGDHAFTSSCYVAFAPTEDLIFGCFPRKRNECAEIIASGGGRDRMASCYVAFTETENLIGRLLAKDAPDIGIAPPASGATTAGTLALPGLVAFPGIGHPIRGAETRCAAVVSWMSCGDGGSRREPRRHRHGQGQRQCHVHNFGQIGPHRKQQLRDGSIGDEVRWQDMTHANPLVDRADSAKGQSLRRRSAREAAALPDPRWGGERPPPAPKRRARRGGAPEPRAAAAGKLGGVQRSAAVDGSPDSVARLQTGRGAWRCSGAEGPRCRLRSCEAAAVGGTRPTLCIH